MDPLSTATILLNHFLDQHPFKTTKMFAHQTFSVMKVRNLNYSNIQHSCTTLYLRYSCTTNTHTTTAYNLPEAYKGKNLHLGDIMDFLITRTDDWYTSRVLPWRMTDQLSVEWNIFRFNKTMA